MKTFILEWNPREGGYGLNDFLRDIPKMEFGDFPWMISRDCGIRSGDNFYVVKTGRGRTGIVMRGFFLSDPAYHDGRQTGFWTYLRPTFMIDFRCRTGIIEQKTLDEALPGLPWGSEVFEIGTAQVSVLSGIWEEYLTRFNEASFACGNVDKSHRPEAGIDEAIALASEAHFDQKDLDGNPVILHPLTVGLSGQTEAEKICGFLHDVIEDTEWTPGEIREKGFSEEIIDTLILLTHEEGIPYMDYVKRIVDSGNQTAIHVKLNDLHYNLERGRKGGYDKLVRKHTEALEYIERRCGKEAEKSPSLRNG